MLMKEIRVKQLDEGRENETKIREKMYIGNIFGTIYENVKHLTILN